MLCSCRNCVSHMVETSGSRPLGLVAVAVWTYDTEHLKTSTRSLGLWSKKSIRTSVLLAGPPPPVSRWVHVLGGGSVSVLVLLARH